MINEDQELYAVVMSKSRNRPLVIGLYDSEEKRSVAVKEYFDSKRISAIMGYAENGSTMYTLPKGNRLYYQTIKINDRVRDNRH